MSTRSCIFSLIFLAGLGLTGRRSADAAAIPHRLASIEREAPGGIVIDLEGRPDDGFESFFDIFYLEASEDLFSWEPTLSLLRTNSSVENLQYRENANAPHRFYRMDVRANPTPFLKPTGPYSVGTTSILLSSTSRNSPNLGTNRSFMVSLFYPSSPQPEKRPEPYLEPIWSTVLFSKEFLYTVRPNQVPISLVSHALPDVPILGGTNAFPVLLYCHGGQYFRRDNIHKLTELASYGYVVASADFYDAWFSQLPDGSLAIYDPTNDFGHTQLSQTLHDFSVLDSQFLLDELARMNQVDTRFTGRLDMGRVGACGWSFGGAVAAELARIDRRVKAAVLYDAAFWSSPEVTRLGLSKPFLCINSTDSPTPDWAEPAINLFNRASSDALFFQLDSSRHLEFSDLLLIDEPGARSQERTTLFADYTRAFFNHYLLGRQEPLLSAPPTIGPLIVNWRKK